MLYRGIHGWFKNEQIYKKNAFPATLFGFFRGIGKQHEIKKTDTKSV